MCRRLHCDKCMDICIGGSTNWWRHMYGHMYIHDEAGDSDAQPCIFMSHTCLHICPHAFPCSCSHILACMAVSIHFSAHERWGRQDRRDRRDRRAATTLLLWHQHRRQLRKASTRECDGGVPACKTSMEPLAECELARAGPQHRLARRCGAWPIQSVRRVSANK